MSAHTLAGALSLLGAIACTAPTAPPPKPAAAAEEAQDPKAPVARWGGEAVTAADLDEVVRKDLRRAENEFRERAYEMKKAALEGLIAKRLVEAKAKAAGKTPEQFLDAEVLSKVRQPSADEVKALYDRAKAAGQPVPPFEQARGDVARYLVQQKQREALRAYYDQLRAEAKVEVLLPPWRPPRIEVAADGPSRGPAKAPVTIVEFSDFECPYCGRAEAVVNQVLETYGDKVRLVYRDYPLPFHPNAPKAAEAAHCAGDQGKYWQMHGKLFANQRALALDSLKGYAKDLGLDAGKFNACLDSGEKAKLVEANRKAGDEAGVSGTPAFFVNGLLISGAQPFEAFKQLVDGELVKK
ncbi:MAG TPA: thioredoxin domain-containing protein [Anaeromyxobacteraceae bacterium]|nr:thioredoxin domain-containing protein [Anaeromyxobacteraceae bacterium]